MMEMTLSSIRTVVKKRKHNNHTWIILLTVVFAINSAVLQGARTCAFMFFRLQYNVTAIEYGNLATTYFITSSITQLFIVRLLVEKFKLRDTTILIMAFTPAIIAWTSEAFTSQIWILYLNRALFYPLWANLSSTSRSLMSKMMEPTEVGKAFSLLGLIESVMGLIFKPLYGMLYRATVESFAGAWVLVSTASLLVGLLLILPIHIGTRNTTAKNEAHEEKKSMKLLKNNL